MEMPAYVQKVAGLDVKQDILRTGGTLFGVHGPAGYLLGAVGHAGFSVAIALAYAGFFAVVDAADALWAWGLAGGLVHYGVAGVVIGLLPAVHPQMPERVRVPGAFYKDYGRRDVLTFLVGHLIFGGLVGVLYALIHSAGGWDAAF